MIVEHVQQLKLGMENMHKQDYRRLYMYLHVRIYLLSGNGFITDEFFYLHIVWITLKQPLNHQYVLMVQSQ